MLPYVRSRHSYNLIGAPACQASGLAVLMVVLGVLAASDRLARHVGESASATPEDVRAFYAVAMGDMLMFAAFIFGSEDWSSHPDEGGNSGGYT